ncbi:uncharacterized protein LOC128993607 isoform X3 [Macrosteles quadrilineatus]|uniref:uncharacterized protein LOC128993607 isoform X3 n=1 Tax=Macrosteles quadrilineatus TaxID=74068 RepID=UPI0023E14352|nr:uncharacterized protein LOC128993607 isoform X3 [Macrosteles quadrilineatus]XP_054273579.1 uncharacterized protein LOC128993607 isoform X3 [Macrosteles quadrilineatus]XP_054273580.1 uncharacterized protein LOC128993607 isoform X3 [Macrosteles quadrilineatus]XP_054273581.1 uncharacterized protein LOC128993607 isoform X3 [Macrosteles quadrilineatus]
MDDTQLPSCVKYWLTEAKHDCFFVLGCDSGPEEKIGAVREILMGYSKPFRTMLGEGEMAEKGNIRVTDVEPDTFRNFLKCIYGASHLLIPELCFEEKAKLLYVYEKYLVDDLKNELIKDMVKTLSFENIFVALSHPVCHVTPRLKSEMISIVSHNLARLVSDDRFLEVNNSGIKWILQLEYIPVEEIELWHAVLKWAKSKTDSLDGNVHRQCIFDLLKYVRFLTMKNDEFWDWVVSTEILNKEEIHAICRSSVSGKPHCIEYLSEITENRCNKHPRAECIKSCLEEYPKYLTKPHSAHFHSYVNLANFEAQQNQYSQTHPWAGHFWYLLVAKRDDCLSVFLGCDGKSIVNCSVHGEMSLINQCGKSDVTRKFNVKFSPSKPDWGFSKFYQWDALLNEDNGFVKDNSVILVVKIQLGSED